MFDQEQGVQVPFTFAGKNMFPREGLMAEMGVAAVM
jgi:hypothetical protein